MKRYRVRARKKDWDDDGPDLLRTRPNSIRAVRGMMGPTQSDGWFIRREEPNGWDKWSEVMSKGEAVNKYENWSPSKDGLAFQFGRRDANKISEVIVAKYELVKDLNVQCNAGAEAIWSLMKAQFPNVAFGGGFVCKQISGSSSWSDHAWRDAIDATLYDANDKGTDWAIRMARSNNLDCDYLIGSREGRAGMSSAPDFGWEGGADASHEWHVHFSYRDHDGRNPGC